MELTYYGHACFSVNYNGKKLLFDPFITSNELAKEIDVDAINADYIFLSHGHTDHVEDAYVIAKNNDATVVGAFEVTQWASEEGISKTHGMNIGGKWKFGFGTVKCVTALHSSSLPNGNYGGNPMGFLVAGGEKNFYYSGDTALSLDMQLIPKWVKLDFAILSIGDNFTMGYEDAIEAAKMIDCKVVVGVHYDTFPPIKIDHQKAQNAFNEAGINLLLPGIGETIHI